MKLAEQVYWKVVFALTVQLVRRAESRTEATIRLPALFALLVRG